MKIVDFDYEYLAYCAAEKVNPQTFDAFIKAHRGYLTFEKNGGSTCVYAAVDQVAERYGLEYRWTADRIRIFEKRGGVNCAAQRGLSKGHINECLDFAVTQG